MNPSHKTNTINNATSEQKIKPDIVAIDVSKATLQVQTAEASFCVPNAAKGFKQLCAKLARQDPSQLLVVFEATGGYERPLSDHLRDQGIALSILNPSHLRAFAKSQGVKAKTDPIDAEMIYRFAVHKTPRVTPRPTAAQRQLTDWLDRRSQLSEALSREQNRLQKTSDKVVIASIKRSLKYLEKEIKTLEKRIAELVKSDPDLNQAIQIMLSIKGVGTITAWTILAYLPEITKVNRNQLAALAGVAPFNHDSGKYQGKRFISGGRGKVRRVLFMAAAVAARHNQVMVAYVNQLINRGKAYKCALTAAMRKLLLHIQSKLKSELQGKIPLAQ
jgi:transposase